MDNVEDIISFGIRVVVFWEEGDFLFGWDLGWYIVIVRLYIEIFDEITIENVSELGKRYNVKVKESVKEGILKVLNVYCDSDFYDKVI